MRFPYGSHSSPNLDWCSAMGTIDNAVGAPKGQDLIVGIHTAMPWAICAGGYHASNFP